MSAVLAQDRSSDTGWLAMTGRSTSNRALVAGGVGNVVEWDDFAVYGAFATIIASTYFPGEVLEDRGWRLAFLVALPLGLVGLYLRLRVDETPRFRAVERADAIVRRPVAATLRAYPGRLLLGLAPVAAAVAARETAFQPLDGADLPETELARPGR